MRDISIKFYGTGEYVTFLTRLMLKKIIGFIQAKRVQPHPTRDSTPGLNIWCHKGGILF
jgi:hypothetical protein